MLSYSCNAQAQFRSNRPNSHPTPRAAYLRVTVNAHITRKQPYITHANASEAADRLLGHSEVGDEANDDRRTDSTLDHGVAWLARTGSFGHAERLHHGQRRATHTGAGHTRLLQLMWLLFDLRIRGLRGSTGFAFACTIGRAAKSGARVAALLAPRTKDGVEVHRNRDRPQQPEQHGG